MTLEERVTDIENRLNDVLGRLAAVQAAIFATAGETDLDLRETLMEDLLQRTADVWLGRPMSEGQLTHANLGMQSVGAELMHAFERPLVPPEFRQPPPRANPRTRGR